MIYKKRIDLVKVQELVQKLKTVVEPGTFFEQPEGPQFQGKWFCPLHVQNIINTFPPVWNFEPECYLVKYSRTGVHELFLTGKILERGRLEYYLGNVKFKGFNNCFGPISEIHSIH